MLFFELKACHEWKVLPSEMGICDPTDDLIMMSAYLSAVNDMQAYERIEDEKRAELDATRRKANTHVPKSGRHIPGMRG